MKVGQPLISCYEEFLEFCSSFRIAGTNHNIDDLLDREKHGISDQMPFGSCLIDYTTGKYMFLSHNSEEILSYSQNDYKQGVEFQYNKILPEDRQIFSENIFPDILRFLLAIPGKEYDCYRFSFSYRYYRKDGCITKLLQHSTYLEPSPCGKPLLNRAVFSDITYFKTDDRMSLTISYPSGDKGYIPVFKKRYHAQPATCISKRELEILNLSMQGLSSKLIADKLFLSIHTVKNHKRHMMEKTATSNISGLIHYAIKNKLLF